MRSASTSGPVKLALRFLIRTACLLVVAITGFLAVIAGCCIVALGLVWIQEGRFLPQDEQMLGMACAFGGLSCVFAYGAWQIARCHGKKDDFFRYRKSSPKPGHRSDLVWLVILFGVFAASLSGVLSGPANIRYPAFAGWLVLGFLGLHFQIFVHELGHFTTAWLMRFQLRRMQIGVGPLLWSCSFPNGLRFEWRAWPLGGLVMTTDPATTNVRRRQVLLIAAGPAADVLVLWTGCSLISSGAFGPSLWASASGLLVGLVLLWTANSLVGSMIPRTAFLGDRKVRSDGYWLWQLVRVSDKQLAILTAQSRWRQALESFQSADRPAWLASNPLPVAPANPAASLAAFRQQHLLLSSRVLRRAKL
jgi:Peptidase family M50